MTGSVWQIGYFLFDNMQRNVITEEMYTLDMYTLAMCDRCAHYIIGIGLGIPTEGMYTLVMYTLAKRCTR